MSHTHNVCKCVCGSVLGNGVYTEHWALLVTFSFSSFFSQRSSAQLTASIRRKGALVNRLFQLAESSGACQLSSAAAAAAAVCVCVIVPY